jgi:hypothetical protein
MARSNTHKNLWEENVNALSCNRLKHEVQVDTI